MTANREASVDAILNDSSYDIAREDSREAGGDVEGVFVAELCIDRSNCRLLGKL